MRIPIYHLNLVFNCFSRVWLDKLTKCYRNFSFIFNNFIHVYNVSEYSQYKLKLLQALNTTIYSNTSLLFYVLSFLPYLFLNLQPIFLSTYEWIWVGGICHWSMENRQPNSDLYPNKNAFSCLRHHQMPVHSLVVVWSHMHPQLSMLECWISWFQACVYNSSCFEFISVTVM